jgi:hypothetical protein
MIHSAVMGATFLIPLIYMKDLGFEPDKSRRIHQQMGHILKSSV